MLKMITYEGADWIDKDVQQIAQQIAQDAKDGSDVEGVDFPASAEAEPATEQTVGMFDLGVEPGHVFRYHLGASLTASACWTHRLAQFPTMKTMMMMGALKKYSNSCVPRGLR